MSYRAHTFAIAAKNNYKTNWTAEYKVNLKKRIDKTYHLACYYLIPVENSNNTLLPSQINATLCTHLIVSFAQVQNNSVYMSLFDIKVSTVYFACYIIKSMVLGGSRSFNWFWCLCVFF